MPEQDQKINQEREVEVTSGEVIKFQTSTDADEFRRTIGHLRIIKGINTTVLDAQYEPVKDQDDKAERDVKKIDLTSTAPLNISNLESLPLPEFVRKIREKRVSQLKHKPKKAA